MHDYLKKILENKAQEVEKLKLRLQRENIDLLLQAEQTSRKPEHAFKQALLQAN